MTGDVRPNDVIGTINHIKITDTGHFYDVVKHISQGDMVTLRLWRSGQFFSTSFVYGSNELNEGDNISAAKKESLNLLNDTEPNRTEKRVEETRYIDLIIRMNSDGLELKSRWSEEYHSLKMRMIIQIVLDNTPISQKHWLGSMFDEDVQGFNMSKTVQVKKGLHNLELYYWSYLDEEKKWGVKKHLVASDDFNMQTDSRIFIRVYGEIRGFTPTFRLKKGDFMDEKIKFEILFEKTEV